MHKKIIPSIILLFSLNVSAVTLKESLEKAYDNDDEMEVIRNDFLIEIEQFPKALSEFIPKIQAEFSESKRREKSSDKLDTNNNSSNNYSSGITLTQSIFSGGSSLAGLKAAKASFRSSRAKYYLYEQKEILKQVEVYLNCIISEDKYKIAQTSFESNLKQFKAMQEKLKFGESTKTEVATTRAALAASKAKLSQANGELKSAHANFFEIFNIEPVDLSLPSIPKKMPENLEQLLTRSVILNPEIESKRNALSTLKSKHVESLGKLLPSIDFTASSQHITREPNAHSTESLSTKKNQLYTASLRTVVPILSRGGAEYSEIRSAKKLARKAVAAYEQAIKNNKYKTVSFWSKYQAALERSKATAEGVKSAEIAYEGITQEERLGAKTIIDVISVERDLLRAREDQATTKKELILAAYQIKSLTGEITAKSLGLNVKYFSPEKEFKHIKTKIIGF